MERHSFGNERLIVPTDFTAPSSIQRDLVPPSHFVSTVQPAGAPRAPGGTPPPPTSWINSVPTSAPSGDPRPASPWLAITLAQQEILKLKKENQRIMMLQGNIMREKTNENHLPAFQTRSAGGNEERSRWESEWWLDAERLRAEGERLKGQVDALKETAAKYREETRDKDMSLSRKNHELEVMREELSKAKIELSQVRERLSLSSAQENKMSLQLEKLKKESDEGITKLRRDEERSKEEIKEISLKAERSRLEAEEQTKQQTLRLLGQLEEMKKKHDVEMQQLNASHCAELCASKKLNGELQDRLDSMTSEALQLKRALTEASSERDKLKEHLSQMGQAFETQSATLHSLRNYIGQLAPDNGEKEQLNETVERLVKEKASLQTTTELLTVRLNSVNEILALQEEKIAKKQNSTDPLVKNGSEVLQVLQLWRQKVFKLCVQLRSKDVEIRREKDKHLSEFSSTEQQLQQEQHRASVLQHSLHDRIAELDLERVEKETLKQTLATVHKDNAELKALNQRAEVDIKTLTSALWSFHQKFENKLTEMDAAKARLNSCSQRLSFAKIRVEMVQGLVMRRAALQKIKHASKQTAQDKEGIRNLQMELSLVREERDKLTLELKRTPELIEKALADLKEQYESKVRQQQQELEHSCMELKLAAASRVEAEQSLLQIQAQLEESSASLERLRCELLRQQEQSERVLQERVSEIEERCAEKLREMEVQVSSARREHTKAVMTLRQFQREVANERDEMRESRHLGSKSTKQDVFNNQLKETERNKHPLPFQITIPDRLMETFRLSHAAAPQTSTSPRSLQDPSEMKNSVETEMSLPTERLMCVLEELHTLSAAVMNSSEDSAEEDGQTPNT
nr:coiled-coil alpha-helical rod protein 1 isoform X1 [Nothobranchius furzeri]